MWSKLGRKLSDYEFNIKLESDYPDLIKLDEYISSNSPIRFSCKRCGKIWNKKPKDLKKIKCNCLSKENEYKEKILNKKVILIDNYINIRQKIKHKCIECNLEFYTSPKSILNSVNGCPSCSGKKFSTDKYKSLLPNNIELSDDEYNGSNNKHYHRCIECGFNFNTKPNYILHMNTNCPNCQRSKGEREVLDYLKSNDINYINEYSISIGDKKLRFDFYLKDHNMFIEYDGIQHYKPIDFFGGEEYYNNIKYNDELKNRWCVDNNYILIRIPYTENTKEYLEYIFKSE